MPAPLVPCPHPMPSTGWKAFKDKINLLGQWGFQFPWFFMDCGVRFFQSWGDLGSVGTMCPGILLPSRV